jgi:hypothetical protein
MPFKKGESGNPTGKPPGAKNKIGIQLRETISNFLINNFDVIQKDFKKLQPKDRAKLYCDLLQYGLPRLQAISNEFQFEKLTDDQLTEVIETLKQTIEHE